MKNHIKILASLLVFSMGVLLSSVASAANFATNSAWCVTNSGAINISYQECIGLAYLYDETNGDNWSSTGGWFSNTNVGAWKNNGGSSFSNSITLFNGHVIWLLLSDGNLSGAITTGLAYLPRLLQTDLSRNHISSVNLSQSTGLLSITLISNPLSTLDLSGATSLRALNVNSTNIRSLDLTDNLDLLNLYADYLQLTGIDLSQNTALEVLSLVGNQLTGLDLRDNTALLTVDVSYQTGTKLQSLNISGLSNMYGLTVKGNVLADIDISTNTNLSTINLEDNLLTSINLSENTNVSTLNLGGNRLTSIDLSPLPDLQDLRLSGNALSSLDISTNTLLNTLIVSNQSGGSLTYIDISSNTGLYTLDLSNNGLTGLTIASSDQYPNLDDTSLEGNAISANSADSDLLRFLHDYDTTWGWQGLGAGKAIVIPKDNCPNGDTSPTPYDRLCSGQSSSSAGATIAIAVGTATTGVLNTGSTTVITGAIISTGSVSIGVTQPSTSSKSPLTNETDVYDRAFAHHITTMPIAKARLHDTIQRYEAAKMMVNFVLNVEGKPITPNADCIIENFSDYSTFDAEMKTNIKAICDLGLMGRKPGKTAMIPVFRPFDTLSAEEFGIVIGRYLGESATNPDSSRRVDIMRFLNTASITN